MLPLRKYIKESNPDIIHAHFSLSAYAATLTFSRKPLVVSLMGSDIQVKGLWAMVLKIFQKLFWKKIIVKSDYMAAKTGLKDIAVIPNGVDLQKFRIIPKEKAQEKLGLDPAKRYIIFVSDPARYEKNFGLLEQAHKLLGMADVELVVVNNVDHQLIPFYMNAADVLGLPSRWEGSPNVVKEAMGCNLPIVSTNVGDVREIMGETEGCFIAGTDPGDFAEKLRLALGFNSRTNGRSKVIHLDELKIAEEIIGLYKEILGKY